MESIGKNIKLKILVGSGRKIGMLALPVLVIGLVLNILFPVIFSVGGPTFALAMASIVVLIPGIIIWLWSAVLILTKIPKRELITSGPYALMKHPLYTGVALMVLPWAGFLFNSWLGLAVGVVVYIGSRLYAPEEEGILSRVFGSRWDEYCHKVLMPWL